MYIDDGSVVTITGSTFSSNTANANENSGAGIWLHSGAVTLYGSTFENNAPNDLTQNGGSIEVSGCAAGYRGTMGDSLATFGENIIGSLYSYSCSACEEGKMSRVGDAVCTDCSAGKFSASTASISCSDCGVNKYNPFSGSSSCFECPTGRYSSDMTSSSEDSCIYYAPNSLAQVPQTVVAGDVVVIPLTLRQHTNDALLGSTAFGSDWVMTWANTTIISSAYNRSFTNDISSTGTYSSGAEGPQITMQFDAAVTWSVSITNPLNGDHFKGSPYAVQVLPSISEPSKTQIDLPSAITAGDTFEGSVRTFDSFLNPTFSIMDTVIWSLDGSSKVNIAERSPSSHSIKISSGGAVEVSGNYQLYMSLNGVSLQSFGFVVLPAAVSAAACTHNLINMGDKTIDSTTETIWEVLVYPRDIYGNAVADPSIWFTLVTSINGGNEQSAILNQGNEYKYELHISAGATLTLYVTFYFKGTTDQIGDASPVVIRVEPKPVESLVPIYVGVGCTLLLMPLSIWVYKQAASRGIERGKEKRLIAADKLALMIRNRKRGQYFWLAVETIDVMSDFLNFLVVVVGGSGVNSPQFILLLAVALMSCPTGFYGVMIRLRMIHGLTRIIEGDAETMMAYEKAMSHVDGGEITTENYAIRLDFLSLDLTVIELALRGMVLEDIPSTIVNLWFVAKAGDRKFSVLMQLIAALISVFLIGRKSGLISKRTEIINVKRDIEEMMEKEGTEDTGVEGGVSEETGLVTRKLSGKLCTEVFGKQSRSTMRLNSRQGSKLQGIVVEAEGARATKRLTARSGSKLQGIVVEAEGAGGGGGGAVIVPTLPG
ncbi:hypothetical protein TrCOL_g3216 [Triparma columacea]|uniref:Tyrosine-protein kinase ephrin type A/B receptor-like domain-containing protein n=1 Tax=Triparma columacea TaxID=722753 RepID=A0A9W7L5E0_9STRA|nr:hypothetical protein TrCOL_g3216 [Triparma columacea]